MTHETVFYELEIMETFGNGTVYVEGEEIETPYSAYFEHTETVEINGTPDEGWNFSHWMGDYPVDEQEEDSINLSMDGNKTLRAYFEDVNETVRHNLTMSVEGEGETVPEEGTHEYYDGELVVLEAIPADCWIFDHWKGDILEHYEGNETEVTVLMDEDKEITANFTESPDCYTLTIQTEGQGTTDPEPGEYRILATEDVEIEAIADSGWYFSEWTGDYEGTDSVITVSMDDDKTVVANFAEEVDPSPPRRRRRRPPVVVVRPEAYAGEDIEGYVFERINFTGIGTIDEGSIEAYRWDFYGDGVWNYESEEDGNTTHVYNESGIYEAVFEVESDEGYTANDTVKVSIYRIDEKPPEEIRRTVVKDMIIDGEMFLYIYDSEENTTTLELTVENEEAFPNLYRLNMTLPEELLNEEVAVEPEEDIRREDELFWEFRLEGGENTTLSISKPGYVPQEVFGRIELTKEVSAVDVPVGFFTRAVTNPVTFALLTAIIWLIREIKVGNFSPRWSF